MRRFQLLWIAALAPVAAAFAWQPDTPAPLASAPKVEIKGTIEKVRATPGEGMPFLEVRTGDKTAKVYLGSIRYLMEQDFNPKAGEEVAVRGYQVSGDIIAITVTCRGKTLKLRDDNGRPVWMRGRRGGPPRPAA